MSRASKIFFGSSIVATAVVVWGVHYVQKVESDNMYLGILKDDERLRQKALLLNPSSSANSSPINHTTPLNTPSSPVQQPAAVTDPDCVTCVISPPPKIAEAQSKEKRAAERRERLVEYEAQKGLAERLGREQGVNDRLV